MTGPACMLGAPNFYFWQVMRLDSGNHPQEAGWVITGCAKYTRPGWLIEMENKKILRVDLEHLALEKNNSNHQQAKRKFILSTQGFYNGALTTYWYYRYMN